MANEEEAAAKKMIRSVLLTAKDGMTAKELQDDYSIFCGGTIPFAAHGHTSLESYLDSIKDTVQKVRNKFGETVYKGVANESTQHIAKLVGRQKTKKKKSRIPRRSMGRAQGPRKEDKNTGYGGLYPRKGGFKGSTKATGQPPRMPLANVQNGPQSQPPARRKQSPGPQESQGKPPRGRGRGSGGGGATNVVKNVPPRFRKKSGEQPSQPIDKPSKTESKKTPISEEDAIDKMMKLLDDHPKGIYLKGMCELFRQKYDEEVSFDLVEKMADMDICHKECILDDHVILYKKLEITAPKDRFSRRQVSMERNVTTTTTMKAPKCLPSLVLPEDNELEVFISLIYDTSHFYCFIVGEDYSERLTELENKMLEFYSEKDQLILEDSPLVGHYYAAKSGNDWLRATVEDIYDGLALCRFADHGDKEEVALSDLRHLPNRFCLLPEQSISCYLDKLDQIQVTEKVLKKFLWLALGHQCYAEIKSRDDPLRVVLYNETRCINDMLLSIAVLDKQ